MSANNQVAAAPIFIVALAIHAEIAMSIGNRLSLFRYFWTLIEIKPRRLSVSSSKRLETTAETSRSVSPIAIIGMGCRYPGAENLPQLWENILGRRRQFRRLQDVRLPISEYHSNDRTTPDKTYGDRAALIDGYAFDWASRRIPKQTYESTDITHWLALDTVLQMLDDAGYTADGLPRLTTQVIVGNTLTGEFTRSNTLRTRWPFVQKILSSVAADMRLSQTTLDQLSMRMERSFKSVFAPANEDTLAGGLANTIAGRICNFLNLNGGGYIVDGACSSSLIAVYTAANSLANGECDFAIAGGVDISLDPFELVGFAKTGALTPSEMSVYDKRGNGFIPGEGCGFVALKRLPDALRDGDKIYAVLDGWGISSDGKGGITAPSAMGQSVALGRAYRKANIDPAELDFIEGHGTGTAVGDKTELLGIARALRDGSGGRRQCGVTSFKSIVGHTKAAAGVGSLIKAALAVNQRVIPPTAGCDLPHEVFGGEADSLYPVLRGRTVGSDESLRAGVSAMGFGGINVHVTLKSGAQLLPGLRPQVGERAAMVSRQEDEVFTFSANDERALMDEVLRLESLVRDASIAEMADLACDWNSKQSPSSATVHAALVAGTPAELVRKGMLLRSRLASHPGETLWIDADQQIAVNHPTAPARVGYVFPGQGSQRLGMARTLVERFDWAAELVSQADAWAAEAGTPGLAATLYPDLDRLPTTVDLEPAQRQLQETQLAQPGIVLCSLLWSRYLERLGLPASCVAGHSLGELTAFHAAGAFDEKTLIQLATLRGQLMAASAGQPGAMVSLACDRSRAEHMIDRVAREDELVIANLNSESQTIASGEAQAAHALLALAKSEGVQAQLLPVSNAFHSPLVANAAEALHQQARLPEIAEMPPSFSKVLVSSCDGSRLQSPLDLRQHFSSQIVRPVDFLATIRTLRSECELLLEVGPGGVLSNLVARSPTIGLGLRAVPVERQPETAHDLNWIIALAHVHGLKPNWEAVYERRIIRAFVPPNERQFIVNPCERLFECMPALDEYSGERDTPLAGIGLGRLLDMEHETLQRYLSERGKFLADVINADLRHRHIQTPTDTTPQHTASPDVRGRLAAPVQALATRTSVNSSFEAQPASYDTEALVLRLAAAATGFGVDRIELSMTLLDDLNLDSIKASALIGEAAAAAGVGGEIDPNSAAGLSLGELAQRIDMARSATQAVEMPSQEATGQPADPLLAPQALEIVMGLAAQYTGFSIDSLQPGFTFVDDLNLDSIKVASLISEAVSKMGLEGRLVASDITAASLQELAFQLDAAAGSSVARQTSSAAAVAPGPARAAPQQTLANTNDTDWVRSFALLLAPQKRELLQEPTLSLTNSNVVVQCETDDCRFGEEIVRSLASVGASVELMDAAALLSAADNRNDITHIVVVLKHLPDQQKHLSSDKIVRQSLKCLRASAIASAKQVKCESVTYFQFGGFSSDFDSASGDLQTCCASSFAASLHLERPLLKVRVLDFDPLLAPDFVVSQFLPELQSSEAYSLSHYDVNGVRHARVAGLIEPHVQPMRNIVWSADDVVLVTGGAKGITAECALSFARTTGVRMVLVGSSAHTSDDPTSEISATLEKYRKQDLVAVYRRCDISDQHALRALIDAVGEELGPVTGVIHGAGVNKPRRVEQCSEDDAFREIGPKLLGMLNLCDALQGRAPKMMAALSSIIGVTGMAGNAWYAWSNEALDMALRRFRKMHPQTDTVALAYSVWAEVGMGAKLGSDKHLGKMGISAIPPKEGVEHFMSSVLRETSTPQVVIASRLGGLDTWRRSMTGQATVEGRFIDETVRFEPGVELVNRVRLSLEDDLYLRDHFYRGVYLFPTVFGLEAMAQAVAKVLGLQAFGSLELQNISLERPIIVASEGGALIQVSAEVQERRQKHEPIKVRASIRTQHTGFRIDHFSAVFVLEDQPDRQESWDLPVSPTDIDPSTELYGGLLFQGPLFQRLRRVWSMDEDEAIIEIESRLSDCYFAKAHSGRLYLGDPSLRDVLLQSAQLCEKGIYLPIGIDSLKIHSISLPGQVRARNRVVLRKPGERICEVDAISQNGSRLESLNGYRLKLMDENAKAASPTEFANPQERDALLLKTALDSACGALGVEPPQSVLAFDPNLSMMDRTRRRLSEVPLFAQAVSQAFPSHHGFKLEDLEIHWEDDGKPVVRGPGYQDAGVSLSHDNKHCLCVAGIGPQGCDIEPVLARSHSQWQQLLGEARMPLLESLVVAGDSMDEAGTRLWSTLECMTKALGARAEAIRECGRTNGAVVLECASARGTLQVLTLSLTLTRKPQKMIAMVLPRTAQSGSERPLQASRLAEDASRVESHSSVALQPIRFDTGPQGQRKVCFRFMTTFKDTTTLRNSVDFPTYANWMGNIRELSVVDVARSLVPDFASGRWGMVTNESSIRILADVHCLDTVEARMHISRVYGKLDSSVDMHFEWVKLLPEGGEQLIAASSMSTTWVEIKGHGIVEVKPFPSYLENFLKANLPKCIGREDDMPYGPNAIFQGSACAWAADPVAWGESLYEAPNAPSVEPKLSRQTFSTTTAESNLVGNIYFSNYYLWQKRLIDNFCYGISPQDFIANECDGEFHFRKTTVKHLREAMPFDRIEVVMALKSMHSKGIKLHFDYYKSMGPSSRIKLAYGECEAVWVKARSYEPAAIPRLYVDALLAKSLEIS